MTSINLTIDTSFESMRDWISKYKEADQLGRSVKLSLLIEDMLDGQPGIQITFSEPVISES